MLKVPKQRYIRYLREVDGCLIQEIADRNDWNEPVHKNSLLECFIPMYWILPFPISLSVLPYCRVVGWVPAKLSFVQTQDR